MAETTPPRRSLAQALLRLPVHLARLPFDLLFLTVDFLRLTAWGIQSLPARLSGGPSRSFRPRFEGGIIKEGHGDTLWHCPLAPKYGTKSLLRLLFRRLVWHTAANGQRSLCWRGSVSSAPTTWTKYLLTAVVLALVWGVPTAALAWRYSGPLAARLWPQRQQARTAPVTSEAAPSDPEVAARLVAQAKELAGAGKKEEARLRFQDAVARDAHCLEAQLGLGRLGLELGLTDDARQAFARAIELDPAETQANFGMAQVLHAQGADRKALELLEAILSRPPPNAEAQALKATCLMAVNDMAGAAAAIGKALELAPEDETSIATAADLELRLGHLEKAESYYRRLIDRNAENLTGRIGLARLLRLKGNYPEAEALLRALLAEEPGELQATEELIDTLLSAGRPLDGLALCREAIDSAPASSRLREKQVGILFGLGRDNELYVAASKLLADSPGNLTAHVQLAAMFLRKGLSALAMDHCNKALAQQPSLESAYRLLTAALLQAGDVEAAKERLERLLTVLPQDLDTIIKLSECLRRRGEVGKAVELLRKGVGYHPGSAVLRPQLAQMLFLAGDAKGALVEFREAHRLAPDDAKALNNLAAAINYADGDLQEALGYAERARAQELYNPHILDTLAWVQARLGHPDKALPFSELALAVQPDLPILRYHRGAILASLGRQEEAKEALKAALRVGADFHGSADARALLAQLSGGTAAAPPPP